MPITSDTTLITADSSFSVSGAGRSVDDYLALITSYHRSRPKFTATVAASLDPLVQAINFIESIPAAFDLDTAIGVQLDAVGAWIGRSRLIDTPIQDIFFAFDDAIRGLDKGVWKGPYDLGSNVNRLDDDTYRLLLRAKILANSWDGSVTSAQAILNTFFTDPASLTSVQDNADGSMTMGISGKIPPVLLLMLFSKGYLPLKPEGVKSYYCVTSINNTPLFGFDVQNSYISGFDAGSWGVTPDYIAQHAV